MVSKVLFLTPDWRGKILQHGSYVSTENNSTMIRRCDKIKRAHSVTERALFYHLIFNFGRLRDVDPFAFGGAF